MTPSRLALVTGASSGIGEAFARALALKGWDLCLVARRQERLATLAEELASAHHIQAHTVRADLSVPAGVQELLSAIELLNRDVALLINNAGIGSYGAFETLPKDRELQMVDLNVRALVALTSHFLPKMLAQGSGGIIQVASTTAFQPVPYMATYGATKSFVLHFTEALARETLGSGVRVLAVCPGHTPTEFQDNSGVRARPSRTPSQTADEVVREALECFENASSFVVVTGWPNRILTQAARVLPRRALSWVVGRGFKPRA